MTVTVMTKDCNSNPVRNGDGRRSQSSFHLACRIWFIPSDEKIARELQRLHQQEREKVWADLSGNEKASSFQKQVIEDKTRISASLEALRLEINFLQNKYVLLHAQPQSDEYLKDRSFNIMFLRYCNYDGKKASKLVIEHLETKRQLFGDESLGRDITKEDLSESEMGIVSSGGLQLLQDRDSAGRAVLLSNFSKLKFEERESLSRVMFYVLMLALKDESIQKHGVLSILNMMALKYCGSIDYEAHRLAYQTMSAIPVRVVAKYHVYESGAWDHAVDVLTHLAPSSIRLRTRSIKGSWKYVSRALVSVGVPDPKWILLPQAKDESKETTSHRLTFDHETEQSSTIRQPKRSKLCVDLSPLEGNSGCSDAAK